MNDNKNLQLEKINKYSRRTLSEEDVYIFDVILCDNEVDRDNERFSHEALVSLKELFVGKTGISDHNTKSENQLARIFDTELVCNSARNTSWGQSYEYLKASVYMVRTEANKALIAEIEGGIKKEVSISCSANGKGCSICGCDKNTTSCTHIKGRKYNEKVCHTVLSDVTDAYEWSFVAVPAQVNAGVTKRFAQKERISQSSSADIAVLDKTDELLRRDIIRLAFMNGGELCAKSAAATAELMHTDALLQFRERLEKNSTYSPQLIQKEKECVDAFSLG